MPHSDLCVNPTVDALIDAVARSIVDAANASCARRGRFAIALAGGSTPRGAYRLLGSRYASEIDWSCVDVYFSDERFVPPEDPRSNFSMANDAWLGRVAIPAAQVHAIPTTGSPAACALRYERDLRATLPGAEDGMHTFDYAVMGIGTDGHTASLFPGDQSALSERERWVLAVQAPAGTEPRDRITLTLPVLNRTRRIVFMASGASKRDPVAWSRSGRTNVPSALVRGTETTEWMIDAAAS